MTPTNTRPISRQRPLYTWMGETLTDREWADRLDLSWEGFARRVRVYGPDDQRTFRRRGPSVVSVTLAGTTEQTPRREHDRAARLEVLDMYLAAFPLLGASWRDGSDSAVLASIRRTLGRLSQAEVGHVLGLTKQRVEQIETVAKKRCKLAGGPALRDAWEDKQELRTRGPGWTTWAAEVG